MTRYLVLLFFLSEIIFSQDVKHIAMEHPLNPALSQSTSEIGYSQQPAISDLSIFAVMVEFAEDNDDRTSGNGKFDLTVPQKPYLDCPPHNGEYFRHHLEFVSDYFEKVSDGQLTISATLFDSVFQLDQPMSYYTPPKNSRTNLELGYLMRDVWIKFDSLARNWGITIPYRDFDAFIIFHAGVGRDIDLASIYGYDPTPFDLPSIYIGIPTLRIMFDDPGFPGIIINGGLDTIKNSIVMPETESRDQVPFPLGINGLLAASVGSYLGLPDLFNTGNGRSGIGRFGLMDGQAIFSWNGAFPPEPSAWEKYFLGWLNPVTVRSSEGVYEFPAVGLPGTRDTSYRVPLSAREYFLIENRNRDANRDGATVRMALGSEIITKQWTRDTVGFTEDDQDSLVGVVLGIDEYDWSLPGGYDGKRDIFYDGGLLIWHIDERIIDANISTNRVNADEDRRGVDLEEADGSQDIGQSYTFLHPGSGSESGTVLDFWYEGNDAPLRRNDAEGFTPSSYPNSLTNDYANSHVFINAFSKRGPRMTARIVIGDEYVRAMEGFPKSLGYRFGKNSLTILDVPRIILISTENRTVQSDFFDKARIFGFDYYGQPIIPYGDSSGLLYETGHSADLFAGRIAAGKLDEDDVYDITLGGDVVDESSLPGNPFFIGTVRGWSLKDQDNNHAIDDLFSATVSREITTAPVISDSLIAYGADQGMVYFFSRNGQLIDSLKVENADTFAVRGLSLFENPGTFIVSSENGAISIIRRTGISSFNEKSISVGKKFINGSVAGTISSAAGKRIAIVSEDGTLYSFDAELNISAGFPVSLYGTAMNVPAIADIDGDGSGDIIVFSGDRIFVYNQAGAMVDNFPIRVPTEKVLRVSPVIADVNGDNREDIVTVTEEGLLFAFDRSGSVVRGFPLQAGENRGSTPAVFYTDSKSLSAVDISIAVASEDGYIYGWKTGTIITGPLQPPQMSWPQYMHDEQNTGYIATAIDSHPRSEDFFPASLAYNWPNPVTVDQGFVTYIRYYVRESARVLIKIFDGSGDLITQFDGPGIGGMENEVPWNVAGISSGIYFAHIEASGLNGGSGSAIIKIAVVK